MLDSKAILVGLAAIWLAACSTSHVMIGKARTPISPDMVQIYMQPPKARYEEIARLDTSSKGTFSFTAQRKTDQVIKRLKAEAAKLGANGVLLEGIGDETSGSFGTGAGRDSYSGGSSVGGGIGFGVRFTQKVGGGLALYVEPK